MADDDLTIGVSGKAPPPNTPELGSVLNGFRLDSVLGVGGQAVVYKARDLTAERDVALKLIIGTDEAKRESLLSEARHAAKLKHDNIVSLLYVPPASNEPFFAVMEFVNGPTLAEVIRSEAPLAEAVALAVVKDVAAALAHAHGVGIVHLDIKPANVLLEQATGRLRLSDFGIAVDHRERWRRPSGGTVPYMAPEQIERRCEQFDGRTDIWGVGVLLYEMLTGRRPFGGPGLASSQVIEEISRVHPKPPSQWNPNVSSRSDAICLRCLEKDVQQRFPSAARLLEEVEAAARQTAAPVTFASSADDHENRGRASKPVMAVGGCLVAIAAAACALLVLFGALEVEDVRRFLQRILKAAFL